MQHSWLVGLSLVAAGGVVFGGAGCASDGPTPSLPGLPGVLDGGGADGGSSSPLGDGGFVPPGTTADSGATTEQDSGPPADEGCGAIKEKTEVTRGPVDVVIALDSSGSMTAEICNVSNNLAAFADGVGPDTRVAAVYQIGIDLIFQFVALCQKQDPLQGTTLAADPQRYLHVDSRVDSHNALEVLLNDFSKYESFLRPGAPTHFVVVSDDESSMPAASFRTQMETLLGHSFYMHAIVATGGSCSGSGVGNQYLELADQTGGQQLSICESDWSALFNKLEAAVAASAPLPCEFDIPEPPPGELFAPDKVSVSFTPFSGDEVTFPKAPNADACVDQVGWHFDDEDAPARIEFCPSACDQVKKGGDLGIAFGCEPPILL